MNDQAARFPTLDDYLSPGLAAVSIGLNPSPMSAASGVYFANPRNRFWPAVRASGLLPADIPPGVAAMRYLIDVKRIGFTDVVKRTTPGAGDLRAADYRTWAPALRSKLEDCRPGVAWFHGKVAYQNFYRYAFGHQTALDWGWQRSPLPGIKVFVTPNPSTANAAFSLERIIVAYSELAGAVGQWRLGNNAQATTMK